MTGNPHGTSKPSTSGAAASGDSRGGAPRSVSDLVAGALRDLGVPSRRITKQLEDAWRGVAEPAWLPYCRLRRFNAGILEISVSSSALCEELENFHRERIRQLLTVALPDLPVVALRFRSGADSRA